MADNTTKNTAEIFCHATNGTYEEFNQFAAEFITRTNSKGIKVPGFTEPAVRTLKCISALSDIPIDEPLLIYTVYTKVYEINTFPYTYGDIVYDIVDSMVTLKEDGMIQ